MGGFLPGGLDLEISARDEPWSAPYQPFICPKVKVLGQEHVVLKSSCVALGEHGSYLRAPVWSRWQGNE